MALKKYATKDAIPAAQQADAIALLDGSFAVSEPDDTTSLTDALKQEREKREAAEKLTRKATDELDKQKKKEKAESHGLTDEQLTKLRAEAVEEVETKRAALEKELADVKTASRSKDIGSAFKTLAGAQKFLSSKHDDLFRLHGDEFDLTDDGKLMVKGKPGIDPAKHMEALAKTRSEWVEGTKAGGGGAAGVTGAVSLPSNLTPQAILDNPGAALAASRAAGKTE